MSSPENVWDAAVHVVNEWRRNWIPHESIETAHRKFQDSINRLALAVGLDQVPCGEPEIAEKEEKR